MWQRHILPRLRQALGDTPVVLVQGARQTGKSTLVQWLAEKGLGRGRYLTLDDPGVLAAASSDPLGFVAGLSDAERPVILDEVQRAPGLFPAIKLAVDRAREPGSFLLTGSANVLLAPKISESLAGRMEMLQLMPLSQGEIDGRREVFIDDVFDPDRSAAKLASESREQLVDRMLRGGYPEVVARKDPRRRASWFGSYLDTVLQRDVRDMAQIEGLTKLPRLLALLAARATGLFNVSDIARLADIPNTTLRRYLTLLEMTFLIHLLPAWSTTLRARLVKSPKLMIGDSGLMAHLQGLSEARLRQQPNAMGPFLENFAAMEIIKQATWSERRVSVFHFRAHKGDEVDLVLEDSSGEIVGVEVKASGTITSSDFKGLRFLQDSIGARFRRGVVLYTGEEAIPFGERLEALPVSALWQPRAKRKRRQ